MLIASLKVGLPIFFTLSFDIEEKKWKKGKLISKKPTYIQPGCVIIEVMFSIDAILFLFLIFNDEDA